MNIKKMTTTAAICLSLISVNTYASKDTTSEDKACDSISALGSMIMQVRQFKPDITSDFLLTKVKETPSDELTGRERDIFERSQVIMTDVIKKAYDKEVVEGASNKKNAIIAFQVQVYDYCLKEMNN